MSTQFTNRQWRLPNNENKDKQSNYSMDFDGSSQQINSGSNLGISGASPRTFSAWMKTTDAGGGYDVIVGTGNSGNTGNNFELDFRSNVIMWERWGLGIMGSVVVNDGNWHHACITYDGNILKLYVDGSEDTGGDFPYTIGATTSTDTPVRIGGMNHSAKYFNGQIDGVAIFNYALTDGTGGTVNQIATLYGSSSTGIGNPMSLSPAPVAYYPLGDQDAFNGANYLVPNSSLKDFVFDFSSDVINTNSLGISGANSRTISCWFNADSTSNQNIIGFGAASQGNNFTIAIYNSNIFAHTWNTGGVGGDLSGSAVTAGKWHLAVMTYDGTNLKISLDGGTYATTTASLNTTNSIFKIGSSYHTAWNLFSGKISNTKVWNTDLSQAEVTTLYNNGSPIQTLYSIPQNSNLQGWWKLDASATYDGADWSIPDSSSNSNTGTSSGMTQSALQQSDLSFKTSISPFALSFDGTDDYIDLTSDITLSGNRTISMWIKVNTGFSFAVLFGGDLNVFYPYIDTNNIAIRNNDTSTAIAHNGISVGVWYNFCVTGNGTTASFYQNGSLLGTGSDKNLTLKYINTEQAGLYGLNGSISNVSVWNAALTSTQVTEIYSEGVPQNLNNHSAYSNLVSWWQLGSNTSWVDPYWIALDEKGTNNGESQNVAAPNNMGENAIVDGVNTYGGGTSSGMSDNIVGSAPFSDANSLSVNMDVLDRTEDTPS